MLICEHKEASKTCIDTVQIDDKKKLMNFTLSSYLYMCDNITDLKEEYTKKEIA